MPQSARVEEEGKTVASLPPFGRGEDKCRNRHGWKEKAKQ